MKLIIILSVTIFTLIQDEVSGNAANPAPGFFLAINKPERGRRDEGDIYVSAINTGPTETTEEMITFQKDGSDFPIRGLPSEVCTLTANDIDFGAFLRLHRPDRMGGDIYGKYGATYTPEAGDPVDREIFLKPTSKILDTGGIFTEVIYPSAMGESSLSDDSPRYIGVPHEQRFARGVRWYKKNERGKSFSARRELSVIEDAGLYTAVRRSRGTRGWAVQIRVIAADCPSDMWWDGAACQPRTVACQNGGVPKNDEDGCTCPPFFVATDCSEVIDLDPVDEDPFVVSVISNADEIHRLRCKDLPGGHKECKCHLFCLGDLYGCKCSPGWTGNACDKPCQMGRWGVECSQECPADDSCCNRFFGPETRV